MGCHLEWQVEKGKVKLGRAAAKRMEKKYGIENLGPWSAFDGGMMNGKLSALRWMMGDEWDMLDP